jgi:hypothetical protein
LPEVRNRLLILEPRQAQFAGAQIQSLATASIKGIFEKRFKTPRYNWNQKSYKLGSSLGTSAVTAAGWEGAFYSEG